MVKGDVDVHSVFATSLPTSDPSFSPQRVLELSETWKASALPKHAVRLFVGVLSASNHFAERMAVRKTWMQAATIKSSDVVVRFFVALVRLLPFFFFGMSMEKCVIPCCKLDSIVLSFYLGFHYHNKVIDDLGQFIVTWVFYSILKYFMPA